MNPAADALIASAANPAIKYIRSLQRHKGREKVRAFVLEGHRALADALELGVRPQLILIDAAMAPERLPNVPATVSVRLVASSLFKELAATQHPQGILAVVPFPEIAPKQSSLPLTLVVDAVRDPGNLGTLMRSAAATGVDRVGLLPTTVDPYNAKVVRAGMGAHFRVALEALDDSSLAQLIRSRSLVALLDARGEARYDELNWNQPAAIIVGGEAFGPTATTRSFATLTVRIPLVGSIESLNAGVAGSVVLFEAARQRRAVGDSS